MSLIWGLVVGFVNFIACMFVKMESDEVLTMLFIIPLKALAYGTTVAISSPWTVISWSLAPYLYRNEDIKHCKTVREYAIKKTCVPLGKWFYST